MAGTISLSLTQQLDQYGTPLAGGKLYFYQAGTVATPQDSYIDVALTLRHPWPITLNAAGRIPQLFLADGSIKVLLADSNGNLQVTADQILVIGPTGSGGGGSTVDPTTVLQTGWLQPIYGTGVVSGFVRCNARTIGSAASGATERANADTLALFTFLYNADANLAVSGGRGASAAADYAANKTIALPDYRGRTIAGLDDMGNTAAGRLTATYFGAVATALGAAGGLENNTLTVAQLAVHKHTNALADLGHFHNYENWGGGVHGGSGSSGGGDGGSVSTDTKTTGITITNANAGSGSPHNNVQPTMLATIYIKM
jgi:microcystin-dependent protein